MSTKQSLLEMIDTVGKTVKLAQEEILKVYPIGKEISYKTFDGKVVEGRVVDRGINLHYLEVYRDADNFRDDVLISEIIDE
jgi:hypothetical protein